MFMFTDFVPLFFLFCLFGVVTYAHALALVLLLLFMGGGIVDCIVADLVCVLCVCVFVFCAYRTPIRRGGCIYGGGTVTSD